MCLSRRITPQSRPEAGHTDIPWTTNTVHWIFSVLEYLCCAFSKLKSTEVAWPHLRADFQEFKCLMRGFRRHVLALEIARANHAESPTVTSQKVFVARRLPTHEHGDCYCLLFNCLKNVSAHIYVINLTDQAANLAYNSYDVVWRLPFHMSL